jgi:putative transposase
MIQIQLDDATRTELQSPRRTALPAVARDRLEMLLLSEAGWSPPRIAAHLGRYPQTVGNFLHDFQSRGTPALYPGKTGPQPDAARRDRVTSVLKELLAQDRTWTSAQLAEALLPHGVELGDRQVRRYLRLMKAGYRGTASTLEHKQDPQKVGRAEATLESLKKSAGGPAEAVLPRRERLQPVAADGV